MNDPDRHERLIETALSLHEARDYAAALPVFQQALQETPECVSAQYNVANTLHMLGRDGEATSILTNLLATNDEIFLNGCPLEEDPAPFKLDALYLVFLTTLYDTESWDDAFPYAMNHLNARNGDVKSIFSDEHIESELESLRSHYQSRRSKGDAAH
jgi:tetratricopeptide (TPR) repeat protein